MPRARLAKCRETVSIEPMKTRREIVDNWLPRYTGVPLGRIRRVHPADEFSQLRETVRPVAPGAKCRRGTSRCRAPPRATSRSSISAWAAPPPPPSWTCSARFNPRPCCSSASAAASNTAREIGDLILPIAAIRGEGTSNDYFPPEVPALPAFALQKAISTTIRDHARDYWTGTVYTTNRRVWEHDEEFKEIPARKSAPWPSTWRPPRSS